MYKLLLLFFLGAR